MHISIFEKHEYFVDNEEGITEEHYSIYRLHLFDKNCSFWFCIIREDYCRIIQYADIVFKLGRG